MTATDAAPASITLRARVQRDAADGDDGQCRAAAARRPPRSTSGEPHALVARVLRRGSRTPGRWPDTRSAASSASSICAVGVRREADDGLGPARRGARPRARDRPGRRGRRRRPASTARSARSLTMSTRAGRAPRPRPWPRRDRETRRSRAPWRAAAAAARRRRDTRAPDRAAPSRRARPRRRRRWRTERGIRKQVRLAGPSTGARAQRRLELVV